MENITMLLMLAGLCAAWHVVSTLLIYDSLHRRGQAVSFIWLRLMSPWYASRYRDVTKTETGKTGPLFYHWVVSINMVLVLVIVAVAVHYI